MKTTLIGFAFLIASAVAFAFGNITAARSAANDISAALGRDPATGQTYLRVYVVNSSGPHASLVASTGESRTMTLVEGASVPVDGTLVSASATSDRPCDLIVFQNGQSQIVKVAPSGTALNAMRVSGTVSASGNPFGYSCSIVLKYTTP
jgi:hypothetical protein